MMWIIAGVIVLILGLLFSGLFFQSSRALTIAAEEKEDIDREPSEQLSNEIREIEKEDAETLEIEGNEFHSTRG